MNKKLYITVFCILLMSFSVLAEENKNNESDIVIFKQYKQDTVKPYSYPYYDNYMNFMLFPYHGYRHGFGFIGYDNYYDLEKENEYLLRNMSKDTLVNPKEYPVELE